MQYCCKGVITSNNLNAFQCFQKETYHTHLVVLYLDNVLQLMKKQDISKTELDQARLVNVEIQLR